VGLKRKCNFVHCPFSFSSLAASITPQAVDVMDGFATEAPNDVLPCMLSFYGSRKLVMLSRVNKKWCDIILSESNWRTACKDTAKVRHSLLVFFIFILLKVFTASD
jgi:hypothetical protein